MKRRDVVWLALILAASAVIGYVSAKWYISKVPGYLLMRTDGQRKEAIRRAYP